jgi:tetratricopeptide (TPR) repeat protein
MYRAIVLVGVVIGGAAMGSAAMAASASEMLEKGIYTEETVGDLDKAISIYQKVVAEGKAAHALAAQAQYHIGQCLLKKGKKGEATAAFQKLVNDFPDQKELVAKARKFLPEGVQLGPVPWVDGETLQLRFRFITGLDIGTQVHAIQSAKLDGRKVWRVTSRTLVPLSNMRGWSRVDADWDTFRPIEAVFKNTMLGDVTTKYSPTRMTVTSEGSAAASTKKIDLTQVVYDNEQAMDVFRRLPWASAKMITLPIIGIGGSKIDLPIEVQGKEMVQVPAGKFECFKLHLGLVNQTLWYATDPHRYLVKFEANSVEAALVSIGRLKPGELRHYEDAKQGFSLAMPNDWFYSAMPQAGVVSPDSVAVFFLDPQMIAQSMLRTAKVADLKPAEQKSVRTWAEAGAAETGRAKKDFKIRPDGRQERKVAGLPAISFVADYTDGKRKMVEYCTGVLGKKVGWKFAASVPQDQFDGYRKQFDAIVDSLKVK